MEFGLFIIFYPNFAPDIYYVETGFKPVSTPGVKFKYLFITQSGQ